MKHVTRRLAGFRWSRGREVGAILNRKPCEAEATESLFQNSNHRVAGARTHYLKHTICTHGPKTSFYAASSKGRDMPHRTCLAWLHDAVSVADITQEIRSEFMCQLLTRYGY